MIFPRLPSREARKPFKPQRSIFGIAARVLVVLATVGASAPASAATPVSGVATVRNGPALFARQMLIGRGMLRPFPRGTARRKSRAGAAIRAADARYKFLTYNYPMADVYPGGINDFGCIAGYISGTSSDSGTPTDFADGFVIRPPYVAADYRLASYPNAALTAIFGINNSGDVAGTYLSGQSSIGFVRIGNTYTSYTNPNSAPGSPNELTDLNDFGLAIGNYSDQAGIAHSFILNLKTQSTVDFVAPGGAGNQVFAEAINDRNVLVGAIIPQSSNAVVAFTYAGGTFHEFSYPNAVATYAQGLNNFGEIVGSYALADGALHGFALKNGKFATVDEPSATTGPDLGSEATGVNDFGVIDGLYSDANETGDGFVAIPKL